MLIGIEASRANKTTKTGVEWYAWHVIQELKKLTSDDPNSWILYTNELLRGGLEGLPRNWYEVRATWPFPYGWTQLRLSWELMRRPPNVMWYPGSTLPRITPKHTVVTVHDVGFHRHPQLYKKRQVAIHEAAMREIAKRAERIITVSEFSGNDIADAYGIDPSRIAITPNGVDHALYRPIDDAAAIEERLRRYRIGRSFFLVIGRLEAKKNIVNIIRAFEQFKQQRGEGDPHALVFVGVPGYGYDEIAHAIKTSPSAGAIHELGYVSQAEMPYLVNAASALIHASWYEGFGLPPVEAMACGCPVIASSAASLPEIISRDAGIFFPPDQPDVLAVAMGRVIDDAPLRDRLRAAGVKRAATFTWENTARATLPVLSNW